MERRHLQLLVCQFWIIATISVYWQVRGHDFVNYDDREYVTGNYHLQAGLTWEGIIWALTTFLSIQFGVFD